MSTVSTLIEPGQDRLSQLLSRTGFADTKGASSVFLLTFVLLACTTLGIATTPDLLNLWTIALLVIPFLLALAAFLFSLANLYFNRYYSDAEKLTIRNYRCRRCRYKWADQDPPYEPYIRRLQSDLARYRRSGNKARIAAILSDLGGMEIMSGGDLNAAAGYVEEALAIRRATSARNTPYTLDNLAFAYYYLGRLQEARALAEEAVGLCRQQHEWYGLTHSLATLAFVRLDQGDIAGAESLLAESLPITYKMADFESIDWDLEGAAQAAYARDRKPRAVRLLAAASKLREDTRRPLLIRAQTARYERLLGTLRSEMGEDEFATVWAQGRAMPLQSAVNYALNWAGDSDLSIPRASV